VWEFIVRHEAIPEFERVYGSEGPWVQLFRAFPGYRGTTLLRDLANPRRYLTVDLWDTVEDRGAMLAVAREQYQQLDGQSSGLTESEAEIGVFERLEANCRPE
jgi:heme-degrading monooxygenase HmoA